MTNKPLIGNRPVRGFFFFSIEKMNTTIFENDFIAKPAHCVRGSVVVFFAIAAIIIAIIIVIIIAYLGTA